jgi:hypothetical protein
MLNRLRELFLWTRAHRLQDEARIRAALKAGWRWALPMWLFPAVAATDWFANSPTESQLILRSLVPFVFFVALAMFGTWRIDIGRKETGVIFYLIPLSVFLVSAITWALVHDRYVR